MVVPEVRANRRKVLEYLRTNPDNFTKITTVPAQGDGRCLIGMIAEALGYHLATVSYEELESAYRIAENGVRTSSSRLWGLNDRTGQTFAEMADTLEDWWSVVEVPVP